MIDWLIGVKRRIGNNSTTQRRMFLRRTFKANNVILSCINTRVQSLKRRVTVPQAVSWFWPVIVVISTSVNTTLSEENDIIARGYSASMFKCKRVMMQIIHDIYLLFLSGYTTLSLITEVILELISTVQEVWGNPAQIIRKDLVKADQFDLWHLRCESNNIVTLIKMAKDMGIVRDRRLFCPTYGCQHEACACSGIAKCVNLSSISLCQDLITFHFNNLNIDKKIN